MTIGCWCDWRRTEGWQRAEELEAVIVGWTASAVRRVWSPVRSRWRVSASRPVARGGQRSLLSVQCLWTSCVDSRCPAPSLSRPRVAWPATARLRTLRASLRTRRRSAQAHARSHGRPAVPLRRVWSSFLAHLLTARSRPHACRQVLPTTVRPMPANIPISCRPRCASEILRLSNRLPDCCLNPLWVYKLENMLYGAVAEFMNRHNISWKINKNIGLLMI